MDLPQSRLLLVEDTPADVEFVRRAVQKHGREETGREWTIEVTDRLDHAVELLQNTSWDVLLLDQRLTDSDERDTLRALRPFYETLPIVVLSSFELSNDEQVRQGAQDYVVKGKFDAVFLLRSIRFAIESFAIERDIQRLELALAQKREAHHLEKLHSRQR